MNQVVGSIAQKNPALGGMLMMGLQMQSEMEAMQEERKEQILKRWEESKKMPRKMKKKIRKELLLDWSIANWNPFEDYKL
jgi:hypothetical protein